MLTVFRRPLPAAFTTGSGFSWGRALVGAGEGGDRMVEGARKPLLGVAGIDLRELIELMEPIFPVLFRVLLTGRAGSAMLGGPLDGRAGRGSVVAIMVSGEVNDLFLFLKGAGCSPNAPAAALLPSWSIPSQR